MRLAIAILAMAVCSFFVAEPAAGQFVEEWEKSKADGNHPTYISDGKDYNARGIAYGMVKDTTGGTMVERVFVASNANGAYRVYVVDPSNGMLLDSLDVSGISGGSRVLNDVAVSNDGIIIACNEANNTFIGGGQDFKCYRWNSLADSPTQVISFLPPDADGDGLEDWVGSHITVTGSASDNSLSLHTAAVNNSPNIYHFSTSDNGTTFAPDTALAGDSSTVNVEDVYPMSSGHLHTAIEEPATSYNDGGDSLDAIPAGVADSLTSLQVFEVNGQTFLAGAKNNFGGGSPVGSNSRVRVANIKNGLGNATKYGETQDLGDTQQFQGNGDVDVRVNDNGTATFFFLSTNNGIAAFTTNQGPLGGDTGPITVDGQTDDGTYRPLGTSPPNQPAGMPSTPFTGGVTGLKAYAGPDSLYVAVEGKVRNGQGDGTFREMMLFINSSNVDGVDSGTPLPPGNDGFSPFCCVDSMQVDMETDFGIRLTGGDDPQAFASFADYAGYVAGDSTNSGQVKDSFEKTLGSLDGTPVTGGATGTRYAYDDTSDVGTVDGTGFEMAIPHSALGTSEGDKFQFFAFYGDVEGDTLSATLVPDDQQTALYRSDEDWTAVSGMQATGSRTVPVELATFTAQRDGENVVLNWKTASETNNAGFAVQHTVGAGDFERIGWVKGAGTTAEAQTYRFVAEDLTPGTHKFRLQQKDLDGTTSLSKAVTVTVQPEGPIAIRNVAPNPVQGTGTLSFTLRESGEVTVGLYDVLGRQVKTLRQGRASAGQHQVTLDATGLSSGVYFIRLKGDSFTKTRRLTVVR